jgi:hypothetical protein
MSAVMNASLVIKRFQMRFTATAAEYLDRLHMEGVLYKVVEGFLEFLMLLQQSLITVSTLCPGPCPRIMSGR